jgi:hypothetical protein
MIPTRATPAATRSRATAAWTIPLVTQVVLAGNSFLHPVDAHRPRTMQFGLKYNF